MYVSVNKKNEIKMVGVSTNPNLTSLYIDDEENPFIGWSEAKICCYKVHVKDGIVMMMTPYVDSRLLEHFDQVGIATEVNASDISDNRDGLMETFEVGMTNTEDISLLRDGLMETFETGITNSEDITSLRDGLMEVYEMLLEESEEI